MTVEPIYVDNTILSTWRSCKEKARLSFVEHWQPAVTSSSLVFGSAFHAALDAFYIADSSLPREERVALAQEAFVATARENGLLPINIDNPEGEKRSIERGLALVEAYFDKWQGESYEVLRDAEGRPLVEQAFEMYLMEWMGRPVFYVGKIDKIVRNRVDGAIYNFETKTTTTGLSEYLKHVRPNHQITGYHLAAKMLFGTEVVGTIWDCTFVSTRQPSVKASATKWEKLGIDMDRDFGRTETRRSVTDLEEFYQDLLDDTKDYLTWQANGRSRWPRNTSACNFYGGCAYKRVCESNGNEMILKNYYEKRVWDPRDKGTTK